LQYDVHSHVNSISVCMYQFDSIAIGILMQG
jgi:hypothetical protein